jgi:regulator of RNase E activity RraA
MALAHETLARLKQVSTATLTTQLFKRGLRNVCIQNVRRVSRAAANLVGEAFTLRYIPAREDLDQISVFENPEHPQRKAIETVPAGQVLSWTAAARRAASAEHLVTRLRIRGGAGIVTDGCLRAEIWRRISSTPRAPPPLNLVCHHAWISTSRSRAAASQSIRAT